MQTSEKDMKILELFKLNTKDMTLGGHRAILKTLLNGLRDEPAGMNKVQSDQEFISLIDDAIEAGMGQTKSQLGVLDKNQKDTVRLMNLKGSFYESLVPFILYNALNEKDLKGRSTKRLFKKALSVARAHGLEDVPTGNCDFELMDSRTAIGNVCTILRCAGFLEKRVSRKQLQCWELEEETTIEHLEALIEYKMDLTFDEMKALGGSTI